MVKLVRSPYSNYEAFLASVETWLTPDYGVFDFLVTGTGMETPLESVKKMTLSRERVGVLTRSMSESESSSSSSSSLDPLMAMWYQSEINRLQTTKNGAKHARIS